MSGGTYRRGKMRCQADCLTPLPNIPHIVSDIESNNYHMVNPWFTLTDFVVFFQDGHGCLIDGNR